MGGPQMFLCSKIFRFPTSQFVVSKFPEISRGHVFAPPLLLWTLCPNLPGFNCGHSVVPRFWSNFARFGQNTKNLQVSKCLFEVCKNLKRSHHDAKFWKISNNFNFLNEDTLEYCENVPQTATSSKGGSYLPRRRRGGGMRGSLNVWITVFRIRTSRSSVETWYGPKRIASSGGSLSSPKNFDEYIPPPPRTSNFPPKLPRWWAKKLPTKWPHGV